MEQIIIEPPLYFAEDHVWSVAFHPVNDILACTLITGAIQILSYNSEDVKMLAKVTEIHKSSARFCSFNQPGTLLATCGKDKRIGFIDQNGKIPHIIKKSHETAVNRVNFLDNNTLMSGDDDGTIKIWDLRTTTAVFEGSSQSEAITGIIYQPNNSFLLSSSLDGTVAVYDIRQGTQSQKKLKQQSDSIDQELLGIQLMKQNRYVVCSTSEGSLIIYKWDQFTTFKDKIQGHPNSIDAMLKLNQDTLITGSQDGFVRGVSVYPNKIVQILGQHQQQENFPVGSLSISHCRKIIASSSHDNSIKFYDISGFLKKRQSGLQNQETQKIESSIKQQENGWKSNKNSKKQQIQENSSDYQSMDDEDSDSDQNQMKEEKPKRRNRKLNLKARKTEIKRQKKMDFFKNL